MNVRHLVKLELMALFLSLLILGTFMQFRLPFFSFVLPQLPDTRLWIESPWFYAGTYTGNLQLPIFFLCLALLNGGLSSLVLITYLAIGLGWLPIFFYGGGAAYLQQPTFGYLLALLPAAWLWMLNLRRHPRRLPSLQKYLLATTVSLLIIHLFGGLYLAMYYQLIPFEFMLRFVMPQLVWQWPATLFVVLLVAQLQQAWYNKFPPYQRNKRRKRRKQYAA